LSASAPFATSYQQAGRKRATACTEDATRLYEARRPDALLMDIRMKRVSGLEAAERILAAHPGARILLLTTFLDDEHIVTESPTRARRIGFGRPDHPSSRRASSPPRGTPRWRAWPRSSRRRIVPAARNAAVNPTIAARLMAGTGDDSPNLVERSRGLAQNVDRSCFARGANGLSTVAVIPGR
jgi:hypothetical protein